MISARSFCPASWRPFEAYSISSNGVFESARFQRSFKPTCLWWNRPQIKVFKSAFKYQEINDHFVDLLIGKVVQKMTIVGRELQVFEKHGETMKLKYLITCKLSQTLKSTCFPRLPHGDLERTRFEIIDLGVDDGYNVDMQDQSNQFLHQLKVQVQQSMGIQKLDRGYLDVHWSHALKECLSFGTHYTLRFPLKATLD